MSDGDSKQLVRDIVNYLEKKDHPLKKLRETLEEYLKEPPVINFNEGKYDLNFVKEFLFPVLVQNEGVQFTIRSNHNCICLKTKHLRFLDITIFLAPGFSYDKFLKACECPQTRGFFPYEWMDSLDKLEHYSLPPHTALYSSLTKSIISDEDYRYCQYVWSDNHTQPFRDFLIWCNNFDVKDVCDALERCVRLGKTKILTCCDKESPFPDSP